MGEMDSVHVTWTRESHSCEVVVAAVRAIARETRATETPPSRWMPTLHPHPPPWMKAKSSRQGHSASAPLSALYALVVVIEYSHFLAHTRRKQRRVQRHVVALARGGGAARSCLRVSLHGM